MNGVQFEEDVYVTSRPSVYKKTVKRALGPLATFLMKIKIARTEKEAQGFLIVIIIGALIASVVLYVMNSSENDTQINRTIPESALEQVPANIANTLR